MSEVTGAALSTGRRGQVLARLRGRRAGSEDALAASLPPLGTTVGGFLLESLLGEGGFGTVYLARRGGELFAVKFTSLLQTAEWGRRELGVMLRLEEVGGVGLKGHGFWPDEAPRFQYIAMEYVPGWELYEWARCHNPAALGMGDVLLELARELAVVHAAGVVHRDLKGDNVLVREGDGLPVLVDFGVATYAGAPRVTGREVPGCREYLSPEAVRFNRESAPGERYPPSALDDLWALGVVAYKLLTATYPFSGHNALEVERAILQEAPEPPHLRNPRVPRALSEVCLRLLEKAPEARYPDADALAAALEAVKRGADEAWQVPLCEAWGPDAATTQRTGALSPEGQRARLRRLVDYEERHPRRGQPRPAPEDTSPPPLPTGGPLPMPSAVVTSSARPRKGARGALGWAVAASVCVLAVGVLAFFATGRGVTPPPLTSPVDSFPLTLEVTPGSGQEVAPPWKPLEGGSGAAPSGAATPAPVASATLPEDTTRVKTSRQARDTRGKAQQKKGTGSPAGKVGGAMLACTLASGCPGPGTQVRPQPPPAECPAGSAEAMEKLDAWSRVDVTLTEEDTRILTVSEGQVTVRLLDHAGKLVAGSTFTGQLIVGASRVYGRFTRGRLPNGETFPVCFEFIAREKPGVDEEPGALIEEPAPEPGLARIFSTQTALPVQRFH
ncbi:serine/threonine-protein kinase [Archangium sp.]|jgi:serine/threonine-protein kinase|uniref:serine/threonine protein kinase n=1 Tax=Archangium sp. TaxID=1872627 RepID=UPI002ED8EDEB